MKRETRILFTNNALAHRGGTELVILDLATEFRRRGHLPMVYSPTLGQVAEELRRACIPVISNLDRLGCTPDIIHGQHHVEAMTAMLHFPETPAIYACHGWLPWEEAPPVFPNIRKYVAVGDLSREAIVTNCGVPADEVTTIPNFVDLRKFSLREQAPAKPRSAVIFDNNVQPASAYAGLVRDACERAGITRLDILGIGAHNNVTDPETRLRAYDIVFAVGRSALEAMSVGCAVILANPLGARGMILPGNVGSMFGRLGLSSLNPAGLDPAFLLAEILKYDPAETLAVSRWIRDRVDLGAAADRYEAVYEETIASWTDADRSPEAVRARFRDAARYVAGLKPLLRQERLEREIRRRQSLISELKRQGISLRPRDGNQVS
jgi:glycosyltransferase involved in cell wall biosynthesis